MKDILIVALNDAGSIPDQGRKHLVAIGLLRITLQHLCIALAEWLIQHGMIDNQPKVIQVFPELREPSDGTLVDSLANLLIGAENSSWSNVSSPFWDSVEISRAAHRIAKSKKAGSVYDLLRACVFSRNDGAEGHGIAGAEDPDAVLDLTKLIVDRLASVLPSQLNTSGQLQISSPDGRSVTLQLIQLSAGKLVCYRRIKRLTGGRCRVEGQRLDALDAKSDVKWEAEDRLQVVDPGTAPAYEIAVTPDPEWSPLIYLPDRITSTFRGREDLISQIFDWFTDTESHACMVVGDGGMGKTTLVLETLHRLLEHPSLATGWKPEMITFFTAKQTRWGSVGIQQIGAGSLSLLDVCRHIVRSWDGNPIGKEWLGNDPAIIDRMGGYLSSQLGIDRKQHLIVLDNAETLITSDQEVQQLAKLIKQLTRRVGRVLLTSRRHEPIAADQLIVPSLTEEEGGDLIRARALDLKIQPAIDAGDSTLRKISGSLGNRPLVLEVLIQTLQEPGLGLKSAVDRVKRMQQQDLGEFLYSDAWRRLSPRAQQLVLLMARVQGVLDEALVKLCCLELDAPVLAAYQYVSESRGIANVTTISGVKQITFNEDFLLFCSGRTVSIDGVSGPSDEATQRVQRRYQEFLVAKNRQVRDRVSSAFRKPFARLAYQAYQDERFADCDLYYEMAVTEDPDNALLYDRYAMYLFQRRNRHEEALNKAIRATQLASQDRETWFTRGIIEARIKKVSEAIYSLDRAKTNGKEPHLVYVQMAHAYMCATPPDSAKARQMLEEAAEATPHGDDKLLEKHRAEMARLAAWARAR
ncbi:MAG: tetratricopeptide repeat protein [Polyangiales bacterium]